MSPIAFRRKTIASVQTLGERLRAARIEKNLTLTDVEQATNVREKYLIALEEGTYDDLPEDVYTLGFLRRYGQFLELSSHDLIRAYCGERIAAEKLGRTEKVPVATRLSPVTNALTNPRVIFTPKLIWFSASVAIVLLIAGYLWYQVNGFMAAPELTLATPVADVTVSEPIIEVAGRTNDYALVTINAEPITLAPDGTFTQAVHLEKGVNTIEIAARNRLNKETRKQLRVFATY